MQLFLPLNQAHLLCTSFDGKTTRVSREKEALLPVFLTVDGGRSQTNPAFFSKLLLTVSEGCDPSNITDIPARRNALRQLDVTAEAELAGRCTALRHPNDLVLLAAADLVQMSQREFDPDGRAPSTVQVDREPQGLYCG